MGTLLTEFSMLSKLSPSHWVVKDAGGRAGRKDLRLAYSDGSVAPSRDNPTHQYTAARIEWANLSHST